MTIEPEVGNILRKRNMTIAVAESCTGGLISSRITDSSGSSDYFTMGVVAYSNRTKENILGVSPRLLKKYGAVSKQVALEMAKGVRLLANADIGIGVTGIAGPSGGTKSKPVGLVYIAIFTNKKRIVKKFQLKGSRKDIKLQASQAALDLIRRTV
jgi:nicotinamide-nucleotide amidase